MFQHSEKLVQMTLKLLWMMLVRTALDVTYAKTPEWKPFRWATSVITESGATVVIPFPRFMFNSNGIY